MTRSSSFHERASYAAGGDPSAAKHDGVNHVAVPDGDSSHLLGGQFKLQSWVPPLPPKVSVLVSAALAFPVRTMPLIRTMHRNVQVSLFTALSLSSHPIVPIPRPIAPGSLSALSSPEIPAP